MELYTSLFFKNLCEIISCFFLKKYLVAYWIVLPFMGNLYVYATKNECFLFVGFFLKKYKPKKPSLQIRPLKCKVHIWMYKKVVPFYQSLIKKREGYLWLVSFMVLVFSTTELPEGERLKNKSSTFEASMNFQSLELHRPSLGGIRN